MVYNLALWMEKTTDIFVCFFCLKFPKGYQLQPEEAGGTMPET